MKTIETGFEGLLIVKPIVFTDERGYFFESYNNKSYLEAGLDFLPVQDNESKSSLGVVRGLHYQLKPFDQAKLIRVIEGKIFDVALDLRRDSPTFGKWYGTELDSESKTQLFIPKGFAHGFSVLSKKAVILYKCDNFYNPEYERGISVMDPDLNIDWRTGEIEMIISVKDSGNPLFRNAEYNF